MCWGQSSLPQPTGGLLASGCSGENRLPETVLSDSLGGLAFFQGTPHGNVRSLPFLNPVFNSLGPLETLVLSEVNGVIVTSLLANDCGLSLPFLLMNGGNPLGHLEAWPPDGFRASILESWSPKAFFLCFSLDCIPGLSPKSLGKVAT